MLTRYPGPLSFRDAHRPPAEARRGADEIEAGLQGDAALRLGILQLLDAGEVPIDQHRVRQCPQMFSRLKLRGNVAARRAGGHARARAPNVHFG